MADLTTTGTSGYATGSIDTATLLVNNVSPTDANHVNGPAAAAVQIETILGSGTTLKGTKASLVERLAVSINPDGTISAGGGATTLSTQDSRTDTVNNTLTIQATTTNTPAPGLGTGILFNAESADENPSNLGQLFFTFADVTAGSEDTILGVTTRVAGAGLATTYQFNAGTTNRALITHSMVANRTITLPDATDTLVGKATTDTLTNKTLSTGCVVPASALNTATGSASGTISNPATTATIALNDYSFTPNYRSQGAGANGKSVTSVTFPIATNSNDFIGRILLTANTSGASDTAPYLIQWRYVTGSDNPVVWVIIDPDTGKLMHVWAADDALPGGVVGVEVPGFQAQCLTAKDFEALPVLSAKANEAAELIRETKRRMEHQAYRAMQLVSNQPAPAQWIFDNLIFDGKQLVMHAK